MRWKDVFFITKGRIGRQTWWFAGLIFLPASMLIIAIAATIGNLIATGSLTLSSSAGGLLALAAFLIAGTFFSVTVSGKRLQDRSKSNMLAWVFALLLVVSGIADAAGWMGPRDQPNALGIALGIPIFLLSLWLTVELGFLKGTIGPNAYGPDPLESGQTREAGSPGKR